MGDSTVITDMQFLYGYLWQIDTLNENTKERTRIFISDDELLNKIAKGRASNDTPDR